MRSRVFVALAAAGFLVTGSVSAQSPEASGDTGAASYAVWYRVALDDGTAGWVAACVATPTETGSDGRPSSVQFNFLPNDRIHQ